MDEPRLSVLAEGKNFNIVQAEEPDGETTVHLELGVVTVHLFDEEWHELVALIREAARGTAGE